MTHYVNTYRRYKRDEPYRFEFDDPIRTNFYMNENSTAGDLQILDISLSGMKVETNVEINMYEDLTLTTSAKIGSYNFTLIGKAVWRKKVTETMFNYGIKLTSSNHQESLKKALIEYQRDRVNNN
jgi:hypothetical protein